MFYRDMRSGARMPVVGLGLWKVPKNVAADVVYNAIKNGYRHLDGACDYGNEVEVGQGIKRAIDEGLVTREDLFIVSKLWNTYHRPEYVEMACRKSLTDLGIDYFDLYYIHFPISLAYVPIETMYPPEWVNFDEAVNGGDPRMVLDYEVTYEQTYHAMEELHRKGLIRDIGVSNIDSLMLHQIKRYAQIMPSALQVEMHPYNTNVRLNKLCRKYFIELVAFSNLGSASYVELQMAKPEDSLMIQ